MRTFFLLQESFKVYLWLWIGQWNIPKQLSQLSRINKSGLSPWPLPVAGLLFYALSSWFAVHYGESGISIKDDQIPYGYFVFLIGSFLIGTSAAILQVVINPYISAYELPGTQPVQQLW